MIVAAGAFHGERHEGGSGGVDAVGNSFDAELLGHRTALVGFSMDAVEGGGQFLIAGGVG